MFVQNVVNKDNLRQNWSSAITIKCDYVIIISYCISTRNIKKNYLLISI